MFVVKARHSVEHTCIIEVNAFSLTTEDDCGKLVQTMCVSYLIEYEIIHRAEQVWKDVVSGQSPGRTSKKTSVTFVASFDIRQRENYGYRREHKTVK